MSNTLQDSGVIIGIWVVVVIGVLELPNIFPWPTNTIVIVVASAVAVVFSWWYFSRKGSQKVLSLIKPTFVEWGKARIYSINGAGIAIAIENESKSDMKRRYLPVHELPRFAEAEQYLKKKEKQLYDKWTEAKSDVEAYNKLDRQKDPLRGSVSERYRMGAIERLYAFCTDLQRLSEKIEAAVA